MHSKEYLLATFEKMYYFEIDRKNTIDSYLSIPIGIMAIEVGFVSVLLQGLTKYKVESLTYLFYISVSVASLLFAIAVYYLFRVLISPQYGYIRPPTEIRKYYDEYVKYLTASRKRNKEKQALVEMQDLMCTFYQEGCDLNMKNNNRKAKYLWRLKVFMIMSIVALVLCLGPYIGLQYKQPADNIQKVQLVTSPLGEQNATR